MCPFSLYFQDSYPPGMDYLLLTSPRTVDVTKYNDMMDLRYKNFNHFRMYLIYSNKLIRKNYIPTILQFFQALGIQKNTLLVYLKELKYTNQRHRRLRMGAPLSLLQTCISRTQHHHLTLLWSPIRHHFLVTCRGR